MYWLWVKAVVLFQLSAVQILFAENSFHVCDCINKINNILSRLTGPTEFHKRESFKFLKHFNICFLSGFLEKQDWERSRGFPKIRGNNVSSVELWLN